MEKACGLDVHKDSVFACILDEQGKKKFEKRYGTLTPELDNLRDMLVAQDCSRVAMESASIYWMPIPTLTVFFRKRMIISCVNFASDTTFTHHRLA